MDRLFLELSTAQYPACVHALCLLISFSACPPNKQQQQQQKKQLAKGEIILNMRLVCAANQQRSGQRGQCGSWNTECGCW